jgi:xylulokinase
MRKFIIAYDLGTGGNKAALYDLNGTCLAENFVPYPTIYPKAGWHEQRPKDWWNAVIESTRRLLHETEVNPAEIECLGISGHSLGVVPIGQNGELLRHSIPIWSDSRPVQETKHFFEKVSELEWYRTTGNGFPAPLYSVFKVMWYYNNEPEMFERIYRVIGTKDYINLCLTGFIGTDFSYASGSGVLDQKEWTYSDRLITTSGLPSDIFPEIVPSTQVIGNLTPDAAIALGLSVRVKVVAGGVDNACMALGARCFHEGSIYTSMGSSSWIAVSSSNPLLDDHSRPFVFNHVVPGQYVSAVPVFSAGSSFRWVRDQLCKNLVQSAAQTNEEAYNLMTAMASEVPPGARGLFFNPSLAGGSSVDPSINIRGAFFGMDLGHSQAEIIRASMEGVAMELRVSLDELRKLMIVSNEMLGVGGGSRSALWRQIYADVFDMTIVKTNVDQQAAALGAAALAAVGTGLWSDFDIIDRIHKVEEETHPIPENTEIYNKLLPVFLKASKFLAELGDDISSFNN